MRDQWAHGECSHFFQSHPAEPVGLFLRDNLARPTDHAQLSMGRGGYGCQGRLYPASTPHPQGRSHRDQSPGGSEGSL